MILSAAELEFEIQWNVMQTEIRVGIANFICVWAIFNDIVLVTLYCRCCCESHYFIVIQSFAKFTFADKMSNVLFWSRRKIDARILYLLCEVVIHTLNVNATPNARMYDVHYIVCDCVSICVAAQNSIYLNLNCI